MAKGLRAVLRPVLPPSVQAAYSFDRPRGPLQPSRSSEEVPTARLPFFRDPRHTGPTKALYRSLLRQASRTPTEAGEHEKRRDMNGLPGLRRDLRETWRRKKGMTSIPLTRAFLQSQLDLLNMLLEATIVGPSPGSDAGKSKAVTQVLDLERHLTRRQAAQDRHRARSLARQRSRSQDPSRRPPRLTGGFIRPTLFNVPLPRLKPQPLRISMMIKDRRRRRERRIGQRRAWDATLQEIKQEVNFWRVVGLAPALPGRERRRLRRDGESSVRDWEDAAAPWLARLDESFARENRRAQMVFDEGLVERVMRARRRRCERVRQAAERRKQAQKAQQTHQRGDDEKVP